MSIPYELIIPSASRPHLLARVLASLHAALDQPPERLLVHDDAVFPGKQGEIKSTVYAVADLWKIPVWFQADNPPLFHGPALHRLLAQVQTEYVLYSQDDHQAVRDLPIAPALHLLHHYSLNQIRFNKRDTMDKKGREGAEFHKIESRFFCEGLSSQWMPQAVHSSAVAENADIFRWVTLCAADHWYFQTGAWRVAAIKPVVDWWASPAGAQHGAFTEHMEVKINQVFNGQWRGKHPDFPPEVPILDDPAQWADPAVRARVHKTFIWGPVGEPAYVQHLGTDPKDWALIRGNREQPEGTG